MAWQWTLIQRDCTGCGICADVCPHAAIRMPRDEAYPAPIPDKCVGCMECVLECPFHAIEVREAAPAG